MNISPTTSNRMSSSSSPNYRTPRGQSPTNWSTPFSSFGTAPSSASIQHQSTMYRTSRGGSQSQSLLNPGDWTQKVDHLKKFFGDEYSPRKQFHTQSTPYGHLHNQRQQHISSPQFQKQSYQTLFENALQKNSIRDRCEEVTKVLQMVSVTELRELFPLLLHDLFGYQNLPNWGFHYLEPRSYPVDYNAMKMFLGPKGILFKIIDKLMTDHDAIFQLPFEILPSGISEAIMKNQVPLFYQHKMQNQLNGSIVINLNPTEYYFALFSYFVLHQKTLQLKSDWTGVEDVLYVHLFESYLNEYLPLHQADNTNLQTTTSLSSATSIKQHGSRSSMSSLWKSPDLHFATTTTNTKLSSTSSYVDHLSGGGNQSTDTETVLQLVTDFWLAFNSEEFIQKEEEYKLPSLDHSRMVRILIKYLHSYLNSCQKNAGVQGFSDRSPSEELQKLVIPSIVYDKLYSYLLHCFNHWPLDSSFRMILETWLSFIQPWRYQTNQNNVSTDDFDGDITSWRTFIQTNSHFYSGLLSVFLLRALKYDLMAIQDVQLIYRVAKVLSQPALMGILHEGIEDSMAGQGSYLSNPYKTESKSGFTSQSHQLQNNDSVFNGSGNTTLFNIENNRHALELCQQMSNTLMGIRHKICKAIDKENNRNNTWLGYFREIFMMNEVDDFSCKRDENRLIDYLEHSCKAFTNFFKLPELPTRAESESLSDQVENINSLIPTPRLYDDESVPEHRVTENGIELTDRGRYQMIQGMRRFDVVYGGDREFQPLRSFESPHLVRLLYRISTHLNNKYGERLHELYNRPDIIGSSLRKISQKGLKQEHYAESAIKMPTTSRSQTTTAMKDVDNQVKPRLTLRFMGSFYFLGYLCWAVVLCRLFDCNWLTIILLTLLVLMVSVLYHVDSPPKSKRN